MPMQNYADDLPGAMSRLDPRHPLVLDTRELSRRPGSMTEVTRTVLAPEALGTDVIAIPAGEPVDLAVRLESVSEGVLVSGVASAKAVGACVRCLDPVRLDVRARFQELFAYTDRAAHHREVAAEDDDDEVYELVDDLVDLESVLLDAVVPALPFQPLCREDCPGLCPQCGTPLAQAPDHRHDEIDPRWSALRSLTVEEPASTNDERRN